MKNIDRRTIVNVESNDNQELKIDHNQSNSVARTFDSDGKDLYYQLRRKIKMNIQYHNNIIFKIKMFFAFGILISIIFSFISVFGFVFSNENSFSSTTIEHIVLTQAAFSKMFALSYMSNLFKIVDKSQATFSNPDLNVKNLANLTQLAMKDYVAFVQDFIDKKRLMFDTANPETFELSTKSRIFKFNNGDVFELSFLQFVKFSYLEHLKFADSDDVFSAISEFSNLNFETTLTTMHDFQDNYDLKFQQTLEYYGKFQLITIGFG